MISHGFNVCLDLLKRENIEKYREQRNNPYIWRWCRQNDLISKENQESWFNNQISDSSLKMYSILSPEIIDSEGSPSAIDFKEVGVCGLTSIDSVNRRGEFSLYIFPEFQKKGLAKKGLKTLFSHGFLNLGLKSIWGETFEDNPAQFLFEGLGMVKEGVRRQFYFKDGRFCDAYLYSMLDTEFREAKWASSTKG